MTESSSLRLELPAIPESVSAARHALSELAERLGTDSSAVRIVVSELVGNAVQHAYVGREPGPVWVIAEVLRRQLVITVADRGRGITPRPDSPGLGFGLPITSKLAREVTIESEGRGAGVSASFDIEAPTEQSTAELQMAVEHELARGRDAVQPRGRRLFRGEDRYEDSL